MATTPLEIATRLRPALLRLYLLYFRQTINSQISQAQLSILMILQENGAMRINQIATAESIRMPTASNAVNQLENMDLVTRIRDVSDRRGVRVDLTDRGRAELNNLAVERSEQLATMLETLQPEELEQAEQLVPLIETLLTRFTEHQSKSKQESK
ncbi:MarR family transcriptional regulator [Corynebacterium sp. 320]|uniref:MarR family transcriptional regulator n=1 Tax=Corynebacterium zhongnanshanii TaxID=2768834 RepID=A0ABQ6VCJ8_9CORY|nr:MULTISPECIES: MarR family transcriptional regulator [Corynebacterium]KAB1502777.1 MarR family transcriptional regulator [Corynebacterium sp. 320]KAB1550482.1 MarR family transcriptional regulator [Corynebacterium sp. 319]KAB1554787.1 MarR family transcriptional regulator [Corynebacterium sp. 321]KAB3519203.1 MarR family transcriptional regulator [Corynebacterium zhongnanshanii]KAB3526440.1 MarR family transcriptional regulator [Corynebacterium sp. 250]